MQATWATQTQFLSTTYPGQVKLGVRGTSVYILSSSRTSVTVKQGLFNAKIHKENGRYIHRLIYELNEQDLVK